MPTSETVIRVEHLSKSYLIGHENQRRRASESLLECVGRGARNFGRTAWEMMRGGQILQGDEFEEFWALKDVNFEVKRGEVIGVIGRNGAGKSTLLKILSRITDPTEGKVWISGRVASLLEVGTGFHPELTGRENVYLNGAILGLRKSEIRAKFDQIVDFAGVERFLDTPVKRYSSGMYVRLAFAVAAHLEPEILIVDEVLAVGDAEFQKKCLGKMDEVAGQGRTVVLVSHNMATLEGVCQRGVLLANQTVHSTGPIADVISKYLTENVSTTGTFPPPVRADDFHVKSITVLNEEGVPVSEVFTWQKAVFRICFYAPENLPDGAVTFQISTSHGQLLVLSVTAPDHNVIVPFKRGVQTIDVTFDALPLTAGDYIIGAGLAVFNTKWLYNEPFGQWLTVLPRDVYNSGYAPIASRYPIVVPSHWERDTVMGHQ